MVKAWSWLRNGHHLIICTKVLTVLTVHFVDNKPEIDETMEGFEVKEEHIC